MLTSMVDRRLQWEEPEAEGELFAGTIPVTLLTGFLGSGKTTLLNSLLSDERMRDAAVIVNEFGSVSVDHDLVHAGSERYVVTSTGCLCCTATSDVRTSLSELQEMAHLRGSRPFSRVIVETTGLADPAPIVNSLIPGGAPAIGYRNRGIDRSFRLANIVTTLDAVDGQATLDRHMQAWKQLAFADHVVLTKGDLLTETEAAERAAYWSATLGNMNPAARLHNRQAAAFDPVSLIGAGFYSPSGKADDVIGWLALEDVEMHGDHRHDPNRHGDIQALQLISGQALDAATMDAFLSILVSQAGSGLLRLKGLVALGDDAERPLVVHAVQHRLYPSIRLECWPSDDRRTRLVLIGASMPREPIRKLFDAVVKHSQKRRTGRRRFWGVG